MPKSLSNVNTMLFGRNSARRTRQPSASDIGTLLYPVHQPRNGGRFFSQAKRQAQDAPLHEFEHGFPSACERTNQETRFRQHGLASEQRWFDTRPPRLHRTMMPVTPIGAGPREDPCRE